MDKKCGQFIPYFIHWHATVSTVLLIYAGPGQFQWIIDSPLWYVLSNAWFCAVLALALNSAAYSTQLFHGAVKAIPKGQWESCAALGLRPITDTQNLNSLCLKTCVAFLQ